METVKVFIIYQDREVNNKNKNCFLSKKIGIFVQYMAITIIKWNSDIKDLSYL